MNVVLLVRDEIQVQLLQYLILENTVQFLHIFIDQQFPKLFVADFHKHTSSSHSEGNQSRTRTEIHCNCIIHIWNSQEESARSHELSTKVELKQSIYAIFMM